MEQLLTYYLTQGQVGPLRPENQIDRFFQFLEQATATDNARTIFLFGFIAVLMIFDIFSGIIAGAVSKRRKFTSKTGINGLLRTIVTLGALILVLPMSALVPGEEVGTWLVQAIYMAYIIFEWTSILENLNDMGIHIKPLQKLLNYLQRTEIPNDKEQIFSEVVIITKEEDSNEEPKNDQ